MPSWKKSTAALLCVHDAIARVHGAIARVYDVIARVHDVMDSFDDAIDRIVPHTRSARKENSPCFQVLTLIRKKTLAFASA